MSSTWIDGALYPDREPPMRLDTRAERVDFIARLCAAWDFGRLPDAAVVVEIRKETWRDVVEVCRLLTSPTYHLLRRWHGLPVLPYLGSSWHIFGMIRTWRLCEASRDGCWYVCGR